MMRSFCRFGEFIFLSLFLSLSLSLSLSVCVSISLIPICQWFYDANKQTDKYFNRS